VALVSLCLITVSAFTFVSPSFTRGLRVLVFALHCLYRTTNRTSGAPFLLLATYQLWLELSILVYLLVTFLIPVQPALILVF
jgi:hypothetical protein